MNNNYFKILKKNNLHHNPEDFQLYLQKLYKNVDFCGKKVLDIGAGSGLHSFYAALSGAKKVVSIEPEMSGAQSGFLKSFEKNYKIFNIKSVSLFPEILQNFPNSKDKFDIIISHYSINHLDESACINLKTDQNSEKVYLNLFRKLYSLLNKEGEIMIVDCSDSNLFTKLGVKNPFAPSIEWEKHQNPNIWINLLKKSGFRKTKLTWLPPYQLKNLGYILLSNKLGGFLTHSHFAIYLKKNKYTKI